jgi:hypothetical protein
VETVIKLHLLNMAKLTVSLFLLCSITFACGQSHVSNKAVSNQNEHLSYDTSRIVILPIDTSNSWIFKDAASTQLTNQDLHIIYELLQECINVHNHKQDTTKEFSEYIDLKKYKLQYIPFTDIKGDKKVYINSFYTSDWGFDYWKQTLVQVEDGGSCFFHLIINLKEKKYEQLFTNGYG